MYKGVLNMLNVVVSFKSVKTGAQLGNTPRFMLSEPSNNPCNLMENKPKSDPRHIWDYIVQEKMGLVLGQKMLFYHSQKISYRQRKLHFSV